MIFFQVEHKIIINIDPFPNELSFFKAGSQITVTNQSGNCGSPKILAQLVTLSRHRKLCRDIVFISVAPIILAWHEVFVATYFYALFLNSVAT